MNKYKFNLNELKEIEKIIYNYLNERLETQKLAQDLAKDTLSKTYYKKTESIKKLYNKLILNIFNKATNINQVKYLDKKLNLNLINN